MTTENTPIPGALNNVIRIDDEQIRDIWTGWYAARRRDVERFAGKRGGPAL